MAKFRSVLGKTPGRTIGAAAWKAERTRADAAVTRWGRKAARAIRNRDRSRDKAVKAKWDRQVKQAVSRQRDWIQKRAKLERQGTRTPKGTEFEFSWKTKYRAPRKLRGLKVVVRTDKAGITKAQAERAAETAIRTGRGTKGVTIRAVDWEGARAKGKQTVATAGSLVGSRSLPLRKQLRAFAPAVRAGVLKRES